MSDEPPPPNASSRAFRAPPRVWLVIGDKLGDNAQVEIIADALGWPVERRRLRFLEQYVHGKPPFKPSLYHIDLQRSDPLEPPWPDLILTVGRRPSMAAMWIRERSAGRAKVVIVGRPKRMMDQFALAIATPQYRLPERSNVLQLELPLMRVDETRIAAESAAWRERFAALRRPLTALLVGGETKPFVFDAKVAGDLVEAARRDNARDGGALYVTTSRRTPVAVVDALEAGLPEGSRMFRWTAGAAENPYHALLGLADRFIVTGDSISMMVEVARLGKPLAIFPLPVRADPWTRFRERAAGLLHPPAEGGGRRGPLGWLGDRLFELNLVNYSRDFSRLHEKLIERGLAVYLGEPFASSSKRAPDDLPRVLERIRSLMAESEPTG
jgi:mitochondrial fission protein ELM1